MDRAFSRSLNRAPAARSNNFTRPQRRRSWITTERPGTLMGQLIRPVDAAGVYVPGAQGGKTPLVSSVLMGAIPARIAGVESIVMATPPRADGSVDPHLLVAAKKVGVHQVFKMGSAWAIGAMAYGTDTVPRVDVIVGPGNVWVTLAKKLVSGTVGIDMIAGPSEILILADARANAAYIAADLLSQAEHDPVASSVLITPSPDLAEAVSAEVETQLAFLSRRDIARAAIGRFGAILVVPDLDAGFDLVNRIAPEHFELMVENPFEYLGQIRNAGAVFIGENTPEPVGDYIAGPNHVLPTARNGPVLVGPVRGQFHQKNQPDPLFTEGPSPGGGPTSCAWPAPKASTPTVTACGSACKRRNGKESWSRGPGFRLPLKGADPWIRLALSKSLSKSGSNSR